MARADTTLDGITRFGGGASVRAGLHIMAPQPVSADPAGVANQPSVLILDSVTTGGVITARYLWVGNDGKLRIHTAYPVTELTDGVTVGSQ